MKIPSAAAYRQTFLDQLQPHLAEPILELGFLSRAGLMDSYLGDALGRKALYSVSPLANWTLSRKRRKTPTTTISNYLVAVTASEVHLFDYPTGRPFEVTGPPTVWPRAGLQVSADAPGRVAQRVHVRFAAGDEAEFDVNRSSGEWATFSDGMLAMLVAA